MKFKFTLYDDTMEVKITGRKVNVGFEVADLGVDGAVTEWVVSNEPLRDTSKFDAMRYDRVGLASWGSPEGWKFFSTDSNRSIEVCTEWLDRLFNGIPKSLWLRRVK